MKLSETVAKRPGRLFSETDREETAGSPTVDKQPPPRWRRFADESHWDGNFSDWGDSPLNLGAELCEQYRREGIELMWGVETVMGQAQDLSHYLKDGWLIAEPNDFPDIPITKYEGCILLARPKSIGDKARALQTRQAAEPLETARLRAGEGDLPGVTLDARQARKSNFIRSSIERIEVPKD